jgi:hypothetical protein
MVTYTVETYDNYDRTHERQYTKVGEFATPAMAIACAQGIVRDSLERLRLAGATPMQVYVEWANAGTGVRIVGETPVHFNPHDYARLRTLGPRSLPIAEKLRASEHVLLGW